MPVITLAETSSSVLVKATDDSTVSSLWFMTAPLDRDFCYRVTQLQLLTDSCDQGEEVGAVPGNWSWFEIGIYENAQATEPRTRDGKPLVWRSHGNRTDPDDKKDMVSRHFGTVFHRREELLNALDIGDVLGVRVCAQYLGWINNAQRGRLIAKVLDEDLLPSMTWTLDSQQTPDSIENGVYTLNSTTDCHVAAEDSNMIYKLWLTTPVLDEYTVKKIQDIQLFTNAHNQGFISNEAAGIWSWFDLVILKSPEETQPMMKDGRALVWLSHENNQTSLEHAEQTGKLFSLKDDLIALLEPGNVIGVRVCARFPGWENHVHDGRLVVRLTNHGARAPPTKPTVDWNAIMKSNQDLQARLQEYLDKTTPEGSAAAFSVETSLLTRELRSDDDQGAGGPPLRLLSLDGGGVRGISELHILKAIMGKITGDPNAKPCDYFDMMAGTSTGGLIAIMLGRLRMSIDECIAAYESLAEKIFNAGILSQGINFKNSGARYSEKVLEQAIKEIVKKYSGNEDEPMKDSKKDCPVFVLACRADNLSNLTATHLRTYKNKHLEQSFSKYKIWEAARATSAAPTYFPRMKLGKYDYVDGGLGFNNPVLLLLGEARIYFGVARPVGCLVTLGTGMDPNIALPDVGSNLAQKTAGAALTIQRLYELATKSEHANLMAQPMVAKGSYFRFNVGIKSKKDPENWEKIAIDLADYKHMPEFVKLTQSYIDTEKERVKECAEKIPPKHAV